MARTKKKKHVRKMSHKATRHAVSRRGHGKKSLAMEKFGHKVVKRTHRRKTKRTSKRKSKRSKKR